MPQWREVTSGLEGGWLNGHMPVRYHFNQPFLIVLQKREAKYPFFVMWADNAELLARK